MVIGSRSRSATLGLLLAWPSLLAGQRELGLMFGSWQAGRTVTYEARLDRPWGVWGGRVFRHGLVLQVANERAVAGRAFYGVGYELTLLRGRTVIGPYGVVSGALGAESDTSGQRLAALWSTGVGLEWRPFRFFAIDAEERYRVSDRGPHGFWSPGSPHKWWSTTVGISIALGGNRRSGGGRSPTAAPRASASPTSVPSAPVADPVHPPLMLLGRTGDVVQTALDVVGSPYQWGGTAQNGFDCSGLIQYAYGRHGIRLPRMSRDQALAGTAIPPVLDSLLPGDILAFAARPGGTVTHVGLYIGDGKFIHSSTTGVRMSRLQRDDPDGQYWIPKWVGARRILP